MTYLFFPSRKLLKTNNKENSKQQIWMHKASQDKRSCRSFLMTVVNPPITRHLDFVIPSFKLAKWFRHQPVK